MKKILFLTLFLFSNYLKAEAQAGTLDPSFGTSGHLVVRDDFSATLFQHDGKLLGVLKDGQNLHIYRYNTDGTSDATFGNGGVSIAGVLPVGDEIISVTEGIDGKILVLNNIINSFPIGRIVIIQLDKNGLLDHTFGVDGVSISLYGSIHGANFLSDIAVQDDAEIVITSRIGAPGGSFLEYGRFNPKGDRINTSAIAAPGYFHTGPTSLAIQPDGKIIVGGFASRNSPFPGNQFIFFISRFNKDGTTDGTFGDNGLVLSNVGDRVNSIAIAADGKIIVSVSGNKMMRYTIDGHSDGSFGVDGIVEPGFEVNKILIENSGNIIAGGGVNDDFAVARYNSSGKPDPAFGTAGKTINDFGGYENISGMSIVGNRLLVYGTSILAAYRLLNMPSIVSIKCPADLSVNNDLGQCGAFINYPQIQVVDQNGQPVDAGSANFGITQSAGLPSGSIFPVGTTKNTFSIQTATNTATCSFTVNVLDKEGPAINGLTASTNRLWPANHKMVDVGINYTIVDNCESPEVVVSITSSDVPVLKKKEALIGDWQIVDPHHIQLRAEKSDNDAE